MEETLASQALRDSEELYRTTLLNMSDAVFITTDDGTFTFVCPNVDVIFGYGEDEVRGMERISRLLGSDLVQLEHLVAAGEVRNIEHEIATKDGAHRILLVHIKRVAIRRGTVLYVCRDITERKQSEQAHGRSQARLRLALEAASAGTWDWDVSTGEMTWSAETHRIFGDAAMACPPALQAFLDRVHPADRERVGSTLTRAIDKVSAYEMEFRAIGYDGIERWILAKGRTSAHESSPRMIGVFVDVTSRHRMAQELHDLGGRLIDAHEQERRRLSRELHDGVGQRVALLSAEMTLLRQQLTGSPPMLEHVRRVLRHIEEVGLELHRVSHELHPAWLEHLGFRASIERVCAELSDTHRIAIHLEIGDIPAQLGQDVALCLYRIAQEALHNVVKHSRAATATVRLEADPVEIVLHVIDDGLGFDPALEHELKGVGLVSMRERARHAGGDLTLTTKPGQGTRVQVRVPIAGSAVS